MNAVRLPSPLYLDWNATAPLCNAAREAMRPWFESQFGNASSLHDYGQRARAAIEQARQQVAALVNAHSAQVIFTSGGSEANNALIKGIAATHKVGRICISAIEHPCVSAPVRQLQRHGWQIETLPVDSQGRLMATNWQAALQNRPTLVSVMLANNETGVIQDLASLAQAARQQGVWLHSDAVQAAGRIPLDFQTLGLHALTLSSHKLGGPVGAGALILDKRLDLAPLIAGGGQEKNLRSGTENVMAIVGFGAACEVAQQRLADPAYNNNMMTLRAQLETALRQMGAFIFSVEAERIENTVFFAFDDIDGATLVVQLDRLGIAVASGSACSSTQPGPSATLMAMGVAPALARGSVRVSLGPATTTSDIATFIDVLTQLRHQLKQLAAVAVSG